MKKEALTFLAVSFVFLSMSFIGYTFTFQVERITINAVDDFGPSLCVDRGGRPHVAWVSGQPSTYDVYYAVKNDFWEIQKVTTLSSNSAFHLSLRLDSDGNPRIAALTETGRWDLWYLWWDEFSSSWITESVANGGSQSHRNVVSLALDSNGSPHVAWAARWGGGLWGVFYAKKHSGTWTIETVSHADDSAPSIALDSSDNPRVFWIHVDYLRNPRMQYASRATGSWVIEDVPSSENGFGNNPRQLAIDHNGVPHVVFSKYISPGHHELWYGKKEFGTWSVSAIRDSSFANNYPSISLNTAGTPHVLWHSNDAGNFDVYLAVLDEDTWETTQITNDLANEGDSPGPSLFIDSADNVHLAWYSSNIGSGETEIYYAGPTWAAATVDIDPDTLNLKSRGNCITCYIELPEGYDPADIDVSTIMLNETIGVEPSPFHFDDYDGDDIPDLMVKFDRAAVESYILANHDIELLLEEKSLYTTLTVTGELVDGTLFEGSDTIRVILPLRQQLMEYFETLEMP